jgi:FKBP-type peptidyl-prolyl cis-trans isomerase
MKRFVLPGILTFCVVGLVIVQNAMSSQESKAKAAADAQAAVAQAAVASKASGTTASEHAAAASKASSPAANTQATAAPKAPAKVTGKPHTTASGVEYWDIKVGTGATAVAGRRLSMHYTGWLTNGQKFDSSLDRGEPFEFTLGVGQVIKGWDEGVAGMKVGGKRQLKIPPAAGYGSRGAGNVIPPNATLIFDVELLSVK